jgi:hypothetical protein
MIRAETERLLNQLAVMLGEKVEAALPLAPHFARSKTSLAEGAHVESVGGLVDRLVALHDPGLASQIHSRLVAGQFRYNARPIVRLLDQLVEPDAQKALRVCLSLPEFDGVAAAVRALRKFFRTEDIPLLVSLIQSTDRAVRVAAIVAAADLGSRDLAEAVAACLDSDSDEEQAAITLGHLATTRFASRIADGLAFQRDSAFSAYVAALEMLRDRSIVPKLIELLRTAEVSKVWDLTHGLWAISGVDPVSTQSGGGENCLEDLRASWLRAFDRGFLSSSPPAEIFQPCTLDETLATFDLSFGRALIRLDVDPPSPGATWPRWNRSLLVAGRPVYNLGSACGTCEFLLRLIRWPDEDLSATAKQLETASPSPLRGIGKEWISTWSPLIEQLRSGHYLVGLLSVPLKRIDAEHPEHSWFYQRRRLRVPLEPKEGDSRDGDASDDWPGTIHYQGPRFGAHPTYTMVMPLHDVAKLDEARVREFERMIERGEHPHAVALAWVDSRAISERFLNLILLNGHHRVEAFARSGLPASIIAIARVADGVGPVNNSEQYLREAFAELRR